MEVRKKAIGSTSEYPLSLLGDRDKTLFFDIETTGLSAHSSCLYLIGCMAYEQGEFVITQFLSESLSQELTVLRAFFDYAKNFDTLISFNGDTFDIPYLNTSAAQYHLASPLPEMKSIDIFKRIRKHKKLMGLENCRLKTIEQFLGTYREDPFSGGELIQVYEEFTKTGDERLKETLLLHNFEDIEGMLTLLPTLSYDDALTSPEDILSLQESYTSRSGRTYYTSFRSTVSFPVEVCYRTEDGFILLFSGNELKAEIPVYYGTLKYFYPDWKQYYYLPAEDMAVHKKLAQFVDKDHRVPATKETAFTRYTGLFARQPHKMNAPVFKEALNASECYVSLNEETLLSYLSCIFKGL